MIINVKKRNLTPENILSLISEYQIYRQYIGKFTVGAAFCSPLRKDRNPSFMIGNRGGFYFHMDLAHPEKTGGCFNFVQELFRLDFNQALQKINQDFALGLGSDKVITSMRKVPETEKTYRTIQVIPKEFTADELRYWGDYYQGLPELKSENVYSVGQLFLDKERFTLPDNNVVFGYLYEDKYWKIYRPLITGRGKWISSVPLTVMDGLEDIKSCKNVIVTKGKKDKMCLKLHVPVCSVQNESLAAFSDDTVTYLRGEVRGSVYVAFDCDAPGVENSWKVTKAFGFKHLNVPYSYLPEGIKDFADLCKSYGTVRVKEYLKSKGVI